MSNEMNLYKRCKNIFKAHGADMGGAGGGELDIIVEWSGNDSVVLIKGNYEAIATKIGHDAITGLAYFTIEEQGNIIRCSGSILSAMYEKAGAEEFIQLVFHAGNLLTVKFHPDGTVEVAMP